MSDIVDTKDQVETDERKTKRSEKIRKDLTSRLNRIEGQVRGLKSMVENDAYCDDILNQLASVQAALNSTGELLLENHIKNCVKKRILSGDDEILDEVMKTIHKLVK